ncbi:MAG: adenosyl-hopene transferase HpnH [Desulfohalobiaceae bacterium]|nr:adenosyl-hopene transferase HpnH [Desulfohalobiaceae bacterium]
MIPVIGGSGFIGSHLVREALFRGEKVRVFDRAPYPEDESEQPHEFIRGDLSDYGLPKDSLRGCDTVFHLAGIAYLWRRDAKDFDRINRQGTENVLKAAKQAGVSRQIYTGTESINDLRTALETDSMSLPLIQKMRVGSFILGQIIRGRRRFPLVLMLEPLFRCNLNCPGCGKIAQSQGVLNTEMSLEDCLGAVEECGAPIVSIPGGEPLLHPHIQDIVAGIIKRRRFVYLCTNGLLVPQKMHLFNPSAYLTFNFHIDGLQKRHDSLVDCPGAFERAMSSIRLLLAQEFRVTTNTTLYAGVDLGEVARLFDFLTELGVEGLTVSPGFNYEAASAADQFLQRQDSREFFSRLFSLARGRGWRFNHSSLYLRFLAGEDNYRCSPWGTPTRNIFGWQRPCYLLPDGYAKSFQELMQATSWESFGNDRDERCRDCMVHCGFEPSAVLDSVSHPLKAFRAAGSLFRRREEIS